jgi:hypothetical protein
MKSVRPQGQGFSQGSLRSGRQNQKRGDLFNPSRLHLLQARKRVTAQSWQQPFVSRFLRFLLGRGFSILHERRWTFRNVSKKLVLGSEKFVPIDT